MSQFNDIDLSCIGLDIHLTSTLNKCREDGSLDLPFYFLGSSFFYLWFFFFASLVRVALLIEGSKLAFKSCHQYGHTLGNVKDL